jgi:hypothetical protein
MKRRKHIKMTVTLSVPHWMTAAWARREVRELVNNQCNYLSSGPDYEEFYVRASKVAPVKSGGES